MDQIKRVISEYDWTTHLSFGNADPTLQVEQLTEVLDNILEIFIPHVDVTVKPNLPPWASKNISRVYHRYRRTYKSYIRNGCKPEMTQHTNDLKNN